MKGAHRGIGEDARFTTLVPALLVPPKQIVEREVNGGEIGCVDRHGAHGFGASMRLAHIAQRFAWNDGRQIGRVRRQCQHRAARPGLADFGET